MVLPARLAHLLASWLTFLPPFNGNDHSGPLVQQRSKSNHHNPLRSQSLTFELRHQHASIYTPSGPKVLFSDLSSSSTLEDVSPSTHPDSKFKPAYTLNTRLVTSHRPSSPASLPHFRHHSRSRTQHRLTGHDLDKDIEDTDVDSSGFPWDEDVIIGPDVESRETLLLLAKMTNNAYVETNDTAWYELGDDWPVVSSRLVLPKSSLPPKHAITSVLPVQETPTHAIPHSPVLPVRLGPLLLRFPSLYLRDPLHLHNNPLHQGHLPLQHHRRIRSRLAHCKERQAQR